MKRSLFVKWTIQSNSDALAAARIKWKNEINSTFIHFNSFTLIKRPSQVELFSIFFFKHEYNNIKSIFKNKFKERVDIFKYKSNS